MSRSKLRPRLENLATNVNLSKRDREFAESLLEYYNKRGSLTAGRRVWLDRLEARAEENKSNPPDTNEVLTSRVSRIVGLSEGWDKEFCESLEDQLKFRGSLSPRQMEIFQKIEAKYSEEAVTARSVWTHRYATEGFRERAIICAKYYENNPPYFGGLARNILNDESFVPDEVTYKKLCENKYALRVIDETEREPVYTVGQLVQFRPRHRQSGKMASVIAANASPVVSAAKGSKVYMVLPFGAPKPILVEERDIKKYRGKKR